MRRLTSRGRGLGVGEKDDAGLALINEGLEGGGLALVGLDIASEAVERDDVANLGLSRGPGSLGGAIGLGSLSGSGSGPARPGLDGLLGLGGGLGGGGDLGGLCLLLCRGRRGRGRSRGLALAEYRRHCDGRWLSTG